jgi:hypothetical protein
MAAHRRRRRLRLAAAATFGVALVLTQHEAGTLDGRVRTTSTMAIVAVLALAGVAWQGGFHWPNAAAGWWGLALPDAALRHRHRFSSPCCRGSAWSATRRS